MGSQYCRLAKLTSGVSAKHMRCFYTSVAIPKMLYTTDLFLVPESRLSKGTKSSIAKLARIQRQASLHIAGTMKMAPTDVVDACTDLLPFNLLVKKTLFQAASRLATLPSLNPLEIHVRKASKRYVRTTDRPLMKFCMLLASIPAEFESITLCKHSAKWAPYFPISIPKSKVAAIAALTATQSKVVVFSDGSGQNGQIGLAAVLYKSGVEKCSLRKHMGSKKLHTVFEAEVLRLLLVTKLILKETHIRSVIIGADSQATLLVVRCTGGTPGQYLLDALHGGMEAVHAKHASINIELGWTPGHTGIMGNK